MLLSGRGAMQDTGPTNANVPCRVLRCAGQEGRGVGSISRLQGVALS